MIPSDKQEFHELAAQAVQRFKTSPGYTKIRDKVRDEKKDASESIFGLPVESLTIEHVREQVRRYQRANDLMEWFDDIVKEGKFED